MAISLPKKNNTKIRTILELASIAIIAVPIKAPVSGAIVFAYRPTRFTGRVGLAKIV